MPYQSCLTKEQKFDLRCAVLIKPERRNWALISTRCRLWAITVRCDDVTDGRGITRGASNWKLAESEINEDARNQSCPGWDVPISLWLTLSAFTLPKNKSKMPLTTIFDVIIHLTTIGQALTLINNSIFNSALQDVRR